MRKISGILLVCLFCVAGGRVAAQHYVGARVGYGGGTSRYYPNEEMGYVWGYKNFGLSWKYYSAERVVGAVQVDLEFMQRGYKIKNDVFTDTGGSHFGTYFRDLNAINVPFSWQPHVYFFRRHLRVFLNAGINLSYNFNSDERFVLDDGKTLFDRPYEMKRNRDNRLGYGLSGGLGFGLLFGRLEYFLEGRYYFGYSDILRNRNIYSERSNPNPLRSPIDNINVSFGVFYRFGKGGILAPTQAEMNERRGNRVNGTQFQKMGG